MNKNKQVTANFANIIIPESYDISVEASQNIDTDSKFGWVNVTCILKDSSDVVDATIYIKKIGGSWNKYSMIKNNGNIYYYNTSNTFSQVGNYSYYISIKDIENNIELSDTSSLSVPPNWDINCDGICSILDYTIISNYYGQTGIKGWIRADVNNNGVVDILDMAIFSEHYSESWWN